jgi:hypothetical protein
MPAASSSDATPVPSCFALMHACPSYSAGRARPRRWSSFSSARRRPVSSSAGRACPSRSSSACQWPGSSSSAGRARPHRSSLFPSSYIAPSVLRHACDDERERVDMQIEGGRLRAYVRLHSSLNTLKYALDNAFCTCKPVCGHGWI